MKKLILLILICAAFQMSKAQTFTLISKGRDSAGHTILNTVIVSVTDGVVTTKPGKGNKKVLPYTYKSFEVIKTPDCFNYRITEKHWFVFEFDPNDKKKVSIVRDVYWYEGYSRMTMHGIGPK